MSLDIWKPIPGYDGYYEATPTGEIRSIQRPVARKNGSFGTQHAQILKPHTTSRGHRQVRLSKEGKSRLYQAARLILETWSRPAKPGEIAVYIDDNPNNLYLPNLTWMTRGEYHDHRRAIAGEQP